MAMEALRIAAKESKFMKFILGGFIFLAVGGLVFTDVGGYFRDGVGRSEIARVGEATISMNDFDRDFRTILQQTGKTAEDAYEEGLVMAYLQGRINSILQLQAARDLNLYIDNEQIARQIRTMFAGMPREQIEMVMRAQGLSEQALADSIRTNLLRQYISAMPMAVAGYVPDFVQSANKKLSAERRSGTLYSISLDSLAENIEVSMEDVQSYYEENLSAFTNAEERSFIIGEMTLDMAKENLPALREEEIRAAYDDNHNDYRLPETRQIEQVTVENPDEAQAIYEEALRGTGLQNALENITGSDENYRTAAPYQKDGLPDELADKAFASNISVGDVTPPVKTVLGYTIMKVTDITNARLQPFEEVRTDIETSLQNSRLYDALYNKMIDTEDMIDSGETFESIASKTEVKTQTTQSYTENEIVLADGLIGDVLTASPSILDELYALSEGNVIYPLELDDDRYVIIGVESITPAEAKPMEAVESEIRTSLKQQRQREYAQAVLSDAMPLNQNSSLLENAQTEPFSNVERNGDQEHAALIYSTPMNSFNYRIEEDQAVVAYVDTVTFVESNDDQNQQDTIVQQQISFIDSLLSQYYRNKTDITINTDLLKQTYSATPTQ
jgi:peptidyl-prolyl cis-trans isomerase D